MFVSYRTFGPTRFRIRGQTGAHFFQIDAHEPCGFMVYSTYRIRGPAGTLHMYLRVYVCICMHANICVCLSLHIYIYMCVLAMHTYGDVLRLEAQPPARGRGSLHLLDYGLLSLSSDVDFTYSYC